MLRLARSGLSYRKEAASDLLLAGPLNVRNDASIRHRMRNISAVVKELGGPVLEAYSPAEQVGRLVRVRLRAILSAPSGFKEGVDEARTGTASPGAAEVDARAEALMALG